MNILFDLDGTLTDPREGIVACFRFALDKLQIAPPTVRALEKMIGPPLRESFVMLLGDGRNERIDRAIALYRERFSTHGLYENALYPGISQALAQLREMGHSLFVATSKPRLFAQQIIDHFELGQFFHAIHGSELDGTNADKTNLIAHVLGVESLSSSDTYMIGDRAHDVVGAKANGIGRIGVLWGYGSRQELVSAGAQTLCEEPADLALALLAVNYSSNSLPVEGKNKEAVKKVGLI